jgi:hypothetical protein
MESTVKMLLLSGDQLVRFGAFIAVFYFVGLLYRARIDGAPYLLFGCVVVLLGEGSKVASFTGMGPGRLWIPGLLLTSVGFCVAAYGFARLARSAIKQQ